MIGKNGARYTLPFNSAFDASQKDIKNMSNKPNCKNCRRRGNCSRPGESKNCKNYLPIKIKITPRGINKNMKNIEKFSWFISGFFCGYVLSILVMIISLIN